METINNMFRRSLPMVYISYQQVLNKDLLRAMRKKRVPLLPIMLFHHDNAPSHRASTTQETIARRCIEVLGYPTYSPDLAPCDFFLFPTLKKILRGRQFDDVADLERAVQSAIASLGPSAYKNTPRTCTITRRLYDDSWEYIPSLGIFIVTLEYIYHHKDAL